MSPLSALAPDQRAVLELLLRQGRDYAELSELLGLPQDGVRARAHAALAALAPERVAPVGDDGAVADWILGQQDDAEAEQTQGAIARVPAWHAWASDVTDRLSEVEGAELPELPQPEADAAAAPARKAKPQQAKPQKPQPSKREGRPRPVRDGTAAAGAQHARRRADAGAAAGAGKAKGSGAQRPRPARERAKAVPAAAAPAAGGVSALRSSRKGGLILLAGTALVVAVVLFFVFRGDDDNPTTSAEATPTPTSSADPQVVTEVPLQGVGNKSQGLMRVFSRQEGGLVFALAADKIPANKPKEVYSVWFTKKGVTPLRLGFAQAQVGKQQVLTTGGPMAGQETKLAKWLVDYDKVVVARGPVKGPKVKKLGPIVLSGTLPGGRD